MPGALIFIGDELISGLVKNLNLEVALKALDAEGIQVLEALTLPDRIDLICERIKQLRTHSSFLIVSGGLGPTDDDLTTLAVAKALKLPLEENKSIAQTLLSCKEYAATKEFAIKMALLPKGAVPIGKDYKTAGYMLDLKDCLVFCLPGVPYQFKEILFRVVIPTLKKRLASEVKRTFRKEVLFFDVNETKLNRFLRETSVERVKIGYYPEFPYLKLVLSGERDEVGGLLDLIKKEFAEWFLGENPLEVLTGELLKEKKQTLGVAESCTGGFLSSLITSVPGSSEYFLEGIVSYSVESKKKILGISEAVIIERGVVSYEVAMEMAEKVRSLAKSDYGIGITGYAGPGGGEPECPVGTVFIGIATSETLQAIRFRFPGNRRQVQMIASCTALDMLRRVLTYDKGVFRYRFAEGIKERH